MSVSFQVPPLVDLNDPATIPAAYLVGGWYYGSITLPSPEIKDGHVYSEAIKTKASRSGLISTFTTKNKVEQFAIVSTYTFTLNEQEAEAAYKFFTVVGGGAYMQFTDHDNNAWIAILLDENIELTYKGPGYRSSASWLDDEAYEFSMLYTLTITIKRWRISLPTT